MKKHQLDNNGIPRISRLDIEKHAELFIKYFDPECLLTPRVTPLATICARLKKDHDVNFVFGADLGLTKEGYKYRGCFDIASTTIYIDKSMPEGGARFNFTLAHELGHFVLHRNIDTSILKNKNKISDTNRDLILDHMDSDNPRTWLEWQANKFASSILLPRSTVLDAVVQKQKEMGLNRNVGKIFLDRGVSSYMDYKDQLEYLSFIYQTSKSSIRIRLRELNILFEGDGSPIEPDSEPASLNKYLASFVDKVLDK